MNRSLHGENYYSGWIYKLLSDMRVSPDILLIGRMSEQHILTFGSLNSPEKNTTPEVVFFFSLDNVNYPTCEA